MVETKACFKEMVLLGSLLGTCSEYYLCWNSIFCENRLRDYYHLILMHKQNTVCYSGENLWPWQYGWRLRGTYGPCKKYKTAQCSVLTNRFLMMNLQPHISHHWTSCRTTLPRSTLFSWVTLNINFCVWRVIRVSLFPNKPTTVL